MAMPANASAEFTATTANDGVELTIRVAERRYPKWSRWDTQRDYNGRVREYYAKPRLYIFPADESVLDNLASRHSRPYAYYKREVIPAVVNALQLRDAKFNWRQTAGCSCPCSPGFIVTCPQMPNKLDIIVIAA